LAAGRGSRHLRLHCRIVDERSLGSESDTTDNAAGAMS
jgi:hypothetical protein